MLSGSVWWDFENMRHGVLFFNQSFYCWKSILFTRINQVKIHIKSLLNFLDASEIPEKKMSKKYWVQEFDKFTRRLLWCFQIFLTAAVAFTDVVELISFERNYFPKKNYKKKIPLIVAILGILKWHISYLLQFYQYFRGFAISMWVTWLWVAREMAENVPLESCRSPTIILTGNSFLL